MGIKKYIIASAILIIAVTSYLYSLKLGEYSLIIPLVDKTFTFPIVLWIIFPLVLLFIATILHMFYYGFKNFLDTRSLQKDSDNLLQLLNQKVLGEQTKQNFKIDLFKQLGDILSQLSINITDANFSVEDKKMSNTAQNILNIKSGKYVSDKVLKLPKENPIMEHNLKNRIDIDENYALEVIKKQDSYSKDLFKYAFLKVIETKSMTTIKKHIDNVDMDIDMINALIKKDSESQNEFSLENTTLLKILKSVELTNNQLIEIARKYKQTMMPEQLMKLVEDISTNNEKLMESYLYVLSEYQMIDQIREILVNSQDNEFIIYKAYLDLRDCGKHYSLDDLI